MKRMIGGLGSFSGIIVDYVLKTNLEKKFVKASLLQSFMVPYAFVHYIVFPA
jgi:hypothetical protein